MTTKKVYQISLYCILLVSIYPVYMGIVMLWGHIKNGGVAAADYPSYIIPYTPIAVALIICAALLPLFYRKCKKLTLPALTALGAAVFLLAEISFERIAVFTDLSHKVNVEIWQLLSCIATPQVKRSVWDSLSIRYNPLFKIHFYAISLLIITAVIGIIYGFYKMADTQNFKKKKPLTAQLVCVIIFIGFCLLACFTAFFRTGSIQISPLSAVLMTVFFLVFGITAGIYAGTWLYNKRKLYSIMVPSVIAMAVTLVMYIGEMAMMNWTLFLMGSGFLFDKISGIPFSLFDILTILLSGIITYFILEFLHPGKNHIKKEIVR